MSCGAGCSAEIPLDERSFDGRFGIGSRETTIAALITWCLGYREQSEPSRAALAQPFGFAALFLLTLLSLAESEAQRSAPHASAPAAASGHALTHDCGTICGVLVAQAAVAQAIGDVYRPHQPSGPRGTARATAARTALARVGGHGAGDAAVPPARQHLDDPGAAAPREQSTERAPTDALKLILYPFTRIQTIAHATREYAEKYDTSYSALRRLVHVWPATTAGS